MNCQSQTEPAHMALQMEVATAPQSLLLPLGHFPSLVGPTGTFPLFKQLMMTGKGQAWQVRQTLHSSSSTSRQMV